MILVSLFSTHLGMELSLYLAQLFSVVLVVVGLAILLRPGYHTKAYKSFFKNEGFAFFEGMTMLIVGLAIILVHNIWVASWEVLITIIGWAVLVKAVLFLFLPKEFENLVEKFMKAKWLLPLGGTIWIIGGLYLRYYAWFI